MRLTDEQATRAHDLLVWSRALDQDALRALVRLLAGRLVLVVGSWVMAPGIEVVELRGRWWWRLLGLEAWAIRRAADRLGPAVRELAPAGARIKLRGPGALTTLRRLTRGRP